VGAAWKINLIRRRYRLRAEWHKRGGRPPKDDRLMVTAMWYVLRSSVPWRDLPERFGPWSLVYTRFRRWCQCGLWARLFQRLRSHAWGQIRSLDCSHGKVPADGANPAGGQALQAMGRTKGGLNTKAAVTVDVLGRLVQLTVAPGPQHDLLAGAPLLPSLRDCRLLAERGFDADGLPPETGRTGRARLHPTPVGSPVAQPVQPPPLPAAPHRRKLLRPDQTPPPHRHPP
jgi:transposase